MNKDNEEIYWNNASNNEFYEHLKAEGLREFAEQKAGLGDCCDLEVLRPYWSNAKSILEVGAGYGRVIDYLLANNFKGKITAVERCNALFEFLKKKLKDVKLIQKDILNFNVENKKFDLIFLLWTIIAEFNFIEQEMIIKILSNLLLPKGKIVIDVFPLDVIPLNIRQSGLRTRILEIDNIEINTILPTLHEIEKYANEVNLYNLKYFDYTTQTKRKKKLYILS